MKKIFLLIGICILLSSFITATDFRENIVLYYQFNDTLENTTDSTGNGIYATNVNTVQDVTGYINKGVYVNDSVNFLRTQNFYWGNNMTFAFWINTDSTQDGENPTFFEKADNKEFWFFLEETVVSANIGIEQGDQSNWGSNCISNLDLVPDVWYQLIVTYNKQLDELRIYANDTIIGSCNNSVDTQDNENKSITIGSRHGENTGFITATYSEFGIWNYSFTESQVNEYFNLQKGENGTYPFYPYVINLDLLYPEMNEVYNYDSFNGSIVFSSNRGVSCTINDSDFSLYENSTLKFHYLNNTNLSNKNYTIVINCTDGNITQILDFWFYIDNIFPIVNNSLPINGSTITGNNYTFYAQFLDNNAIWQYNISLINGSGFVVFNNFTKNISMFEDKTESIFQKSLYIAGWQDGIYNYQKTVWDSHTKKNIKRKLELAGNEKIEFDSNENYIHHYFSDTGTMINIFFPKKLLDIDTIIDTDRIKYKFKPIDKNNKKDYYLLNSNKEIVYIPQQENFIIDGKYWHDFKGLDVNEIIKIDNYNYLIKFTLNDNTDFTITDSTGILNKYFEESFFYIDNTNPYIVTNVSSSTNSSVSIQILMNENINYNYTFGTNCTGALTRVYNGSFINFVLSESGLESNTTYYFNVTFKDIVDLTNNYCLSIDTDITAEVTAPIITDEIGYKTTAYILFLLWISILLIGFLTKNPTVVFLSCFSGFFVSIWFFKYLIDSGLVLAVFIGVNAYLMFYSQIQMKINEG